LGSTPPPAAQGFFAAHGFTAAHGFLAAQGFLRGAHGFFAAQGFFDAHGLAPDLDAAGLAAHGLHGFAAKAAGMPSASVITLPETSDRTIGFSSTCMFVLLMTAVVNVPQWQRAQRAPFRRLLRHGGHPSVRTLAACFQ
jgi:hypothetical protein